jgi:hypothetical protein
MREIEERSGRQLGEKGHIENQTHLGTNKNLTYFLTHFPPSDRCNQITITNCELQCKEITVEWVVSPF